MAHEIISYFDQLTEAAKDRNVSLEAAFEDAGAGLSTFYRVRGGADMRLSTAVFVMEAINRIASEREAA